MKFRWEQIGAVLGLLWLYPYGAAAEWIETQGSYLFPPSMTEDEACFHAEERARIQAIRQVSGETITAEEMVRCTEQGDENQCARNSALWSSMQGYIRRTGDKRQHVRPSAAGHRECVTVFSADVVAAEGRPDPAFDVGIWLTQPVVRHGEDLVLSISPSQPMWVHVYQWLPYRGGQQAISKIFPNIYDTINRFDGPTTIPTPMGTKRYHIQVEFPPDQPASRRLADEYLMVVATRSPLSMRESYSLDDFRRLLAELPRADSRVVRKAYHIVRGD